MVSSTNLIQYYADRADEYDNVYLLPERQEDIRSLKQRLSHLLASHHVLEISCGTGYWTEVIAGSCQSVMATDINEKVLDVARRKTAFRSKEVVFSQEDSFSLKSIDDRFSAGFAGFWWSHIPKARLGEFLDLFHSKFLRDALIVFVDNIYVHGESAPIAKRDAEGNTYQERSLENGTTFEVIKNFPGQCELIEVLGKRAKNIKLERLTYYWILSYNINETNLEKNP
jgi:SAM-dependent methyltransferase